MSPSARERRRHVRMRPIPDLPAEAKVRTGASLVPAIVSDISIAGLGLSISDELEALGVNATIDVEIDLGRHGHYSVQALVRHVGRDEPGVVGAEFVGLKEDAYTAVKRYVAELLERGAPS